MLRGAAKYVVVVIVLNRGPVGQNGKTNMKSKLKDVMAMLIDEQNFAPHFIPQKEEVGWKCVLCDVFLGGCCFKDLNFIKKQLY